MAPGRCSAAASDRAAGCPIRRCRATGCWPSRWCCTGWACAPGATLRLGEAQPRAARRAGQRSRTGSPSPSILGPRVLMPLVACCRDRADAARARIAEHRLRAVLPAGHRFAGHRSRPCARRSPTPAGASATPATGPPGTRAVRRPDGAVPDAGRADARCWSAASASPTACGPGWRRGRAASPRCAAWARRRGWCSLVQALQLGLIGAGRHRGSSGWSRARRWPVAGRAAAAATLLPVPPQGGVQPAPLALAAAFGVLTAATFALAPLARAMRIPGAALFRDAAVLPAGGSARRAAGGEWRAGRGCWRR